MGRDAERSDGGFSVVEAIVALGDRRHRRPRAGRPGRAGDRIVARPAAWRGAVAGRGRLDRAGGPRRGADERGLPLERRAGLRRVPRRRGPVAAPARPSPCAGMRRRCRPVRSGHDPHRVRGRRATNARGAPARRRLCHARADGAVAMTGRCAESGGSRHGAPQRRTDPGRAARGARARQRRPAGAGADVDRRLGGFEADPAAAEQQQRGRGARSPCSSTTCSAPAAAFVGNADLAPGSGLPAVVPDGCDRARGRSAPRPRRSGRRWRRAHGGARPAGARADAGEARLGLDRPGYCSPASPTCGFAAGRRCHPVRCPRRVCARQCPCGVATAGPRPGRAARAVVARRTPRCRRSWRTPTRCGPTRRPAWRSWCAPRRRTGHRARRLRHALRRRVAALRARRRPCALAPDGTAEMHHGRPDAAGRRAWPPISRGRRARTARSRATPPAAPSRVGAVGRGAVAVARRAFADGPWCPSPAAPTRWDADLARVAGVRGEPRRGRCVGAPAASSRPLVERTAGRARRCPTSPCRPSSSRAAGPEA